MKEHTLLYVLVHKVFKVCENRVVVVLSFKPGVELAPLGPATTVYDLRPERAMSARRCAMASR